MMVSRYYVHFFNYKKLCIKQEETRFRNQKKYCYAYYLYNFYFLIYFKIDVHFESIIE